MCKITSVCYCVLQVRVTEYLIHVMWNFGLRMLCKLYIKLALTSKLSVRLFSQSSNKVRSIILNFLQSIDQIIIFLRYSIVISRGSPCI